MRVRRPATGGWETYEAIRPKGREREEQRRSLSDPLALGCVCIPLAVSVPFHSIGCDVMDNGRYQVDVEEYRDCCLNGMSKRPDFEERRVAE